MTELFDFIDLGCGTGGSIDWVKANLGGNSYLGIDIRQAECNKAKNNGYNVFLADVTSPALILPKSRFVTMIHVLEHLNNEAEVELVVRKALESAEDYIFIKGPTFKSNEYLKNFGFKLTWTDWWGHKCPVDKDMLFRVLHKCNVRDYQIDFAYHQEIENSLSPEIVPITAPTDSLKYEEQMGKKEVVEFTEVHREFTCKVTKINRRYEEFHPILLNVHEWMKLIDLQGTFAPRNIVEIGSMNGKDACDLEQRYSTGNVIVIEAHPKFYESIKTDYPTFFVHQFAASNRDGIVEFNAVFENSVNVGISSMLDREEEWPSYGVTGFDKITVPCKRMDTFMKETGLSEIDVLKIDVEGNSYEVLTGFGEKLKSVKTIHLENEHVTVWKNQKLYRDCEDLLVKNGFIMVHIKIGWPQSDSVWIRSDLIKKNWWL